jgi:uncharacterized membrane protein
MSESPFGETRSSPTYPPPQQAELSSALARNIDALKTRRSREEREATLEERVAETITGFTGSMLFVYLHILFFGFWIVANLGWIPRVPKWDESFVVLGMAASVEAIFLSTFVLISQNRMARAADKRAELDLQISLLAEHEITKLVGLTSSVARHMSIDVGDQAELQEIQQDVSPEAVLDEIEAAKPNK